MDKENEIPESLWKIRNPYYAKVYYFFYRRFLDVIGIPRSVKWWLQRLIGGYDERDIYDLHWYIVRKLRPVIKDFVKYQCEHGHSLPLDFSTNPAGWLEVLQKIEYSFDMACSEESLGNTPEDMRESGIKVQEGFELFGKYLRDFWD